MEDRIYFESQFSIAQITPQSTLCMVDSLTDIVKSLVNKNNASYIQFIDQNTLITDNLHHILIKLLKINNVIYQQLIKPQEKNYNFQLTKRTFLITKLISIVCQQQLSANFSAKQIIAQINKLEGIVLDFLKKEKQINNNIINNPERFLISFQCSESYEKDLLQVGYGAQIQDFNEIQVFFKISKIFEKCIKNAFIIDLQDQLNDYQLIINQIEQIFETQGFHLVILNLQDDCQQIPEDFQLEKQQQQILVITNWIQMDDIFFTQISQQKFIFLQGIKLKILRELSKAYPNIQTIHTLNSLKKLKLDDIAQFNLDIEEKYIEIRSIFPQEKLRSVIFQIPSKITYKYDTIKRGILKNLRNLINLRKNFWKVIPGEGIFELKLAKLIYEDSSNMEFRPYQEMFYQYFHTLSYNQGMTMQEQIKMEQQKVYNDYFLDDYSSTKELYSIVFNTAKKYLLSGLVFKINKEKIKKIN